MTANPNSTSERRAELARIHIAIAELGWPDDDYRAILRAKTGKSSAAELDAAGRQLFLKHLRDRGWKPAGKGPKLNKQQWLVRKLWRELGDTGALEDKSDAAMLRFIKGQGGPDALHFLNTSQASLVIEALKAWLKRARSKQ